MKNNTFKQKPVAVVTGAAGGIGRAIAAHLAKQDYCVALADINQEGLEQVLLDLGDGSALFIHDVSRYHCDIKLRLEPRTLLLRRALLESERAADPVGIIESVLEAGRIDTGNNFHFVMPYEYGMSGVPPGCFEVDDNETHEDGFVTLRTSMDVDVNGTDLTEALFVTNHHRKRYSPGSCWRYESMIDSVNSLLNPKVPDDESLIDLDDMHWVVKQVEADEFTVHTILFKPSDWTLRIFRVGTDHLASEDIGVQVPREALFPW